MRTRPAQRNQRRASERARRERERERREERGEGRSPVIGGGGGGGGKERLFLGVLNLGRFLDSSFQRGFALLCFAFRLSLR